MTKAGLLVSLFAAAAWAQGPIEDDPRARTEAEAVVNPRTAEAQLQILRTARAEAQKYAQRSSGSGGILRFATIQDAASRGWVSLGPAAADFDYNGGFYDKVDSGRIRKIIVDPGSPDVVYAATSGGGVWKTFDASNPIASGGPHWLPITETIGSLSIGSLAMDPTNAQALLLGLGDPLGGVRGSGMLHSGDGGATWSSLAALAGSYAVGGGVYTASSVRDAAFSADGATALVATDVGLFRSTLGNLDSWSLVSVSGAAEGIWSLAAVGAQDWLLTSVDYGSAPAGHLWSSADDGASWTEITGSLPVSSAGVGRMTLAAAPQPAGGFRVYLLAENQGESAQSDVFRSDDGGGTWSSLAMKPGGRAPANPTGDQADLDFMHGQSWYNQMIAVDPANPDIVFVGGNLSMGRSTDGGTTWYVMTDWFPLGLGASNGGLGDAQYAHADWHAAAIAHSGGVAYFYGGNDGGLIRATEAAGFPGVLTGLPGSVTWEDKINRGIVSHLAYSVSTGRERPATGCTMPAGVGDLVFGGLQDNGSRMREIPADGAGQTPTTFNQIVGGDGFGVGIGCTPGGAMGSSLVATYAHMAFWSGAGAACRTTSSGTFDCFGSPNGGTAFKQTGNNATTMNPAINLDGQFTFRMRIAADLTADRTYLTPLTDDANLSTGGCGWVYRSTDGGQTWGSINGAIATAVSNTCTTSVPQRFPYPMRNVAADPVNPGHYGAVANGGRAFVTVDAGAHWTETSRLVSLPGGDYLGGLETIAFDPADTTGNTVWVGSKAGQTAQGAPISDATGRLFMSTNALLGASATWTPMHNGLPNVPINVVKLDPSDHLIVYVGTEIGLYRSTDGGASFSLYGSGLPMVSITDLAIDFDGSAVRVSTFGRGFWEIHPDPAAPAGVAGNGDFDHSQQLDGFDLVREAAVLGTDASSADYSRIGNLTGATNVIDVNDWNALVARLGGRP